MKPLTRAELFNLLNDRIRKVFALESEGYTMDGYIYSEGVAYWYYSPIGSESLTASKTYDTPLYPQGCWIFLGLTIAGVLVHEESRIVAEFLETYMIEEEVR